MFRYVALCWNHFSPDAANQARAICERVRSVFPSWRNQQGSGWSVFCSEDVMPRQMIRIPERRGLIIGTLFQRPKEFNEVAGPCSELTSSQADQVAESQGRYLVEQFWGSYIAVVADPRDGTYNVLKAPAGGLPCLYTTVEDVTVFSSYLPDLERAVDFSHSIDWSYIAKHVLRIPPASQTCFSSVRELTAGSCYRLSQARADVLAYWNAEDFCATRFKEVGAAVHAVREVTRHCIWAWGASYDSIVALLSGGLDSSIVVSCLSASPRAPRILCLNEYSANLHGELSGHTNTDERPYARLVAARAQVALKETFRNHRCQLSEGLGGRRSERPLPYSRSLPALRSLEAACRDTGAGAAFTGTRGDELFFRNRTELAACDYVSERGLGRDLFELCLYTARMQGLCFWPVLGSAIAHGYRSRRYDLVASAASYNTLVSDDITQQYSLGKCPTQPRGLRELPIGKQYHLASLTNAEGGYPAFEGHSIPDYVAPLYSQPLVELCLSIPTFLHTQKGWDRALARQAFAEQLPTEVARRRSKGGMEEFSVELLRANLSFIRAMLLDGVLVRERILDRKRVESALSDNPSGIMKGMAKLYQHLDVEMWFSIMHSEATRKAA